MPGSTQIEGYNSARFPPPTIRTPKRTPMHKRISATPVAAAAVVTSYASVRTQPGNAADRLPMPKYHHIHLNSMDPQRSLDWYSKYWPAGKITSVAGFPAFEGGNGLALLYT